MCKRKLESKKEALLILSKELDTCQQERDQYKLMANQLRERHQSLKKKYRELIVSDTVVASGHALLDSNPFPTNSLPVAKSMLVTLALGMYRQGIRTSRPSLAM